MRERVDEKQQRASIWDCLVATLTYGQAQYGVAGSISTKQDTCLIEISIKLVSVPMWLCRCGRSAAVVPPLLLLSLWCTSTVAVYQQSTSISYVFFWRFYHFFLYILSTFPRKVLKCSPIRNCNFGRRNVPTLTTFLRFFLKSEVWRRRPPGRPRKRT
jgi:hypothetical protein